MCLLFSEHFMTTSILKMPNSIVSLDRLKLVVGRGLLYQWKSLNFWTLTQTLCQLKELLADI